MAKITFVGAGSTVFAKNLLNDIFSYPSLADATISLHDINEDRLRTTCAVAQRLAEARGAHPILESHSDRRAALDGANYVVTMFQIGGYEPSTVIDFEVPKKYGLRQTIADSLGIGGIFRALRTIPVFLAICQEMEEVCPDALLLNYVNPMAMNTWAINRATRIRTVGLCHSVQGTAEHLAHDIRVPVSEIQYLAAGINHMAFYLKFERKTPDGAIDLYPEIRRVIDEDRVPENNRVRYEMCKRLGYFVTESSEHFAEYVPWFIKRDRPDLVDQFDIPLDEYITRCQVQIAGWEFARKWLEMPEEGDLERFVEFLKAANISSEKMRMAMIKQATDFYDAPRSLEYGSGIINSVETGQPSVIYGNVMNHGLIDNLPQGCCVEVPCLVDANGVQPVRVGSMPLHLANLIQTNVNVQSLAVEAALTRKRQHIYHAAMLDPHTAAELDLDQIWRLVDDMIEAHGDWLPQYN